LLGDGIFLTLRLEVEMRSRRRRCRRCCAGCCGPCKEDGSRPGLSCELAGDRRRLLLGRLSVAMTRICRFWSRLVRVTICVKIFGNPIADGVGFLFSGIAWL